MTITTTCTATACDHSDHVGRHTYCEHCTLELATCGKCGAVYVEWEDGRPEQCGWVKDKETRMWRCGRCRT